MACPYFEPLEKAEFVTCGPGPRLPLGGPYSGLCRAGAEPFAPSLDVQRDRCNRGYARGLCPRFPAAAEFDAVRFSPCGETGGAIDLIYVFERDHAPVRHGVLQCLAGAAPCDSRDAAFSAQVRMFVESYLSRRSRP